MPICHGNADKPNETERVDGIPLLLAQMDRMNRAALLDKHFPMRRNWQGLGLGEIVVVWLAYILSEGDRRLNAVQGWVAGILLALTLCLKAVGLRKLDFSDGRLAVVVVPSGALLLQLLQSLPQFLQAPAPHRPLLADAAFAARQHAQFAPLGSSLTWTDSRACSQSFARKDSSSRASLPLGVPTR
jgi:hypothetical protein